MKLFNHNGFTQMFSRIEQKTGTVISNGRMDQYLYPYYKKDKEEGILTDEKAIELLECIWVAKYFNSWICISLQQVAHLMKDTLIGKRVIIGGQTKDGNDATNDLTYLFLQSKREFPLNYPDLAA